MKRVHFVVVAGRRVWFAHSCPGDDCALCEYVRVTERERQYYRDAAREHAHDRDRRDGGDRST